MARKPKVTVNCVASHYAAPDERIIEFSAKVGLELVGGLIRFHVNGDRLYVTPYAMDPKVEVSK